ncbi:hypothetical protein Hanom_Chr09g00835011 [Helianthus anomalus]
MLLHHTPHLRKKLVLEFCLRIKATWIKRKIDPHPSYHCHDPLTQFSFYWSLVKCLAHQLHNLVVPI